MGGGWVAGGAAGGACGLGCGGAGCTTGLVTSCVAPEPEGVFVTVVPGVAGDLVTGLTPALGALGVSGGEKASRGADCEAPTAAFPVAGAVTGLDTALPWGCGFVTP